MSEGEEENQSSYHLELAQRDFYQLIDEPMEFSTTSVAKMVSEIAEAVADDYRDEAYFLRRIAIAMRGDDPVFKFEMKHKKRGRFVTPDRHHEQFLRKHLLAANVHYHEGKGMKREAAVHAVMAYFSVSRQTVFTALQFETMLDEAAAAINASLVSRLESKQNVKRA